MKKVVTIALVGILFAGCATPFGGSTIVSRKFEPSNQSIALMYEIQNYNAMHLWYMPHLTQALINNGYQVVERLQIGEVIKELGLDEAEMTRDKSEGAEFDSFTPANIKEIGKLYGINYLGIYGQWPGEKVYFRIVDCETAEVVAVSVFTLGPNAPKMGVDFARDTADIVVLSLEYSALVTNRESRPKMVYLDLCPQKKKPSKMRGIDEVLYQKKITIGTGSGMYAVIFTKCDD